MMEEHPSGFGLWIDVTQCPTTEYEKAWLPVLDPWGEPSLPIAVREGPLNPCGQSCAYGTCNAPRTYYGCGGCCHCLGGCQVEYENQQTAPHTWTGDNA